MRYEDLTGEMLEEHLSNYLISSWSLSKVNCFARNQKAFEMEYLYQEAKKTTPSGIAGQIYHTVLNKYFTENINLTQAYELAFNELDKINANEWKIQKTTPTVLDCQQKCLDITNKLILHAYEEYDNYLQLIDKVIASEVYISEWISLNGVEIPLICNGIIDRLVKLKDGKHVIIDDKSVKSFSTAKEREFTGGKQAIIYYLLVLKKFKIKVDEVWFIENKYSKNKDKSSQLNLINISIDDNISRLYQALLYEGVKLMIEAVNNPDHIYLINDSDKLVNQEDIYNFWVKTQLCEIDAFDIDPTKKDALEKRHKKIRNSTLDTLSPKVLQEFKKNTKQFITFDYSDMTKTETIESVLKTFGHFVQVAHHIDGYSCDTYLVQVQAGTKISEVKRTNLDIANAINATNVRFSNELVKYNSKSFLAIEETKKRTKSCDWDSSLLVAKKIPIGMDNYDNVITWDLDCQATPHMLVCGATGSGKSISLNSTIEYAKLAGVDDFVILDPKCEFAHKASKHVEVIDDYKEIQMYIELLVDEMQHRIKNKVSKHKMIIFDEFASVVQSSIKKPKELQEAGLKRSLEDNIQLLLQKGRSSGYRIVLAAQRLSAKLLNGDAKANLSVQVCFRVPKEIDSKVVLDEGGAEMLGGSGDGLIRSPEYNDIVRFQGFFREI